MFDGSKYKGIAVQLMAFEECGVTRAYVAALCKTLPFFSFVSLLLNVIRYLSLSKRDERSPSGPAGLSWLRVAIPMKRQDLSHQVGGSTWRT